MDNRNQEFTRLEKEMFQYYIERVKQNFESYSTIDQCVRSLEGCIQCQNSNDINNTATTIKSRFKFSPAYLSQTYFENSKNYSIACTQGEFINALKEQETENLKFTLNEGNKLFLCADRVDNGLKSLGFQEQEITNLPYYYRIIIDSVFGIAAQEVFNKYNTLIINQYSDNGIPTPAGQSLSKILSNIPKKVADELQLNLNDLKQIIDNLINGKHSLYDGILTQILNAVKSKPQELKMKEIIEMIKQQPTDIAKHLCRLILAEKPKELEGMTNAPVITALEAADEKNLRDIFLQEENKTHSNSSISSRMPSIINFFKSQGQIDYLNEVKELLADLEKKDLENHKDLESIFLLPTSMPNNKNSI